MLVRPLLRGEQGEQGDQGEQGEQGEQGGARLTNMNSGGGTPAERRQEILDTTLKAVKRCQVPHYCLLYHFCQHLETFRVLLFCSFPLKIFFEVRYGGKQELATEGSEEVQGLLNG